MGLWNRICKGKEKILCRFESVGRERYMRRDIED